MFIRHGESEWNDIFNKGFTPSFLLRLLCAPTIPALPPSGPPRAARCPRVRQSISGNRPVCAAGVVREAFKLFSMDSVFIDSPLSAEGARPPEQPPLFPPWGLSPGAVPSPRRRFPPGPVSAGVRQARGLALYLQAAPGNSAAERALKARAPGPTDPHRLPLSHLGSPVNDLLPPGWCPDPAQDLINRAPGAPPSVVASSNLRRALATGGVALSARLHRTREPVHVLSSLQEITVNIDALAITPARADPDIPGARTRRTRPGGVGRGGAGRVWVGLERARGGERAGRVPRGCAGQPRLTCPCPCPSCPSAQGSGSPSTPADTRATSRSSAPLPSTPQMRPASRSPTRAHGHPLSATPSQPPVSAVSAQVQRRHPHARVRGLGVLPPEARGGRRRGPFPVVQVVL